MDHTSAEVEVDLTPAVVARGKWDSLSPFQTQILLLAVAAIFAGLGSVGTYWLNRQNWTEQQREQRLDIRRAEAGRVFDTTIITLSRITTSLNPLMFGLQRNVSRDSALKLVAAYDRDVYAFETQAPRLQSLIKGYFDNRTIHQFTMALGASAAMHDEIAAYLAEPPKRPVSPDTMRRLMVNILTLSDHMAEQLASGKLRQATDD